MTEAEHTILFADISGSTKLYEEHGDAKARAAVAECLAIMSGVTERFTGEVIKTLGDEIMCSFGTPKNAVFAANEMQLAVRQASEAGRFVTGELHVKIGIHHGPGERIESHVLGEASIIAQQVTRLAKADQILASGETIDALPPELRLGSRFLDTVVAEGRSGDLEVMELIWEVSGLTQVADARPVKRDVQTRLRLTRGSQRWVLGPDDMPFTLGRVSGNDAVVATELTSRSHAEITHRQGGFHLSDNSSNGTVLTSEDGRATSIKRESHGLRGVGTICLGGTPETNPKGVIAFVCD